MDNFIEGLLALTNSVRLFFYAVVFHRVTLGFFAGVFLTLLVTVFMLTKDPRHVPHILLYSSAESFERIASQDTAGTYTVGFTDFLKIYTQVRILSLIALISFCVMMTTILVSRSA